MGDFSPNRFADIYIDSALEIIGNNKPLSAEKFYNYIFSDVSKKTGFSKEDVTYLHHAFHWILFLGKSSPFELFFSGTTKEEYWIKLKNGMPEKSKLVETVLENHKIWLEKRMEQISNLRKTSN